MDFEGWPVERIDLNWYSMWVRSLILKPFINSKSAYDTRRASTLESEISRVTSLRRRMLASLKPLIFTSESKFDQAVTCPPYRCSAVCERLIQPCWMVDICPWCWGRRRVAPMLRALRGATYTLGLGCSSETPELLPWTIQRTTIFRVFDADEVREAGSFLKQLLDDLGDSVRRRFPGYMLLGTLNPDRTGGKVWARAIRWLFRERGVTKDPGIVTTLPGIRKLVVKAWSIYNPLMPKTILNIRFSREMLCCRDPNLVSQCLQVMKDCNLLRFAGVCRGHKSRKEMQRRVPRRQDR